MCSRGLRVDPVWILDSVFWGNHISGGGGKFDAFFNFFLYIFGEFLGGGEFRILGGDPPGDNWT